MKIKNSLLIAISLLLCSCAGNGANSASYDSSNNESSSEITSSTPSINPLVANSKWGLDAAQKCLDTLGIVIPYLAADSFEVEVTKDDYGDPAIWFYLYYETSEIAEAKITEYAYAAYEQDSYECVVQPERMSDPTTYSYWEQLVLHANKILYADRAVEIIGLDSLRMHNGVNTPCLGLFCFTYIPNTNPNSFPSYPVFTLLGQNKVPTLSGVPGVMTYSFSFFIMNDIKCLEIVVKSDDHSYDLEEEYFYQLIDNGYFISQYDDLANDFTSENFVGKDSVYPDFADNYCYYAYDSKETHTIYFDYDLNAQALYIDILPEVETEQ